MSDVQEPQTPEQAILYYLRAQEPYQITPSGTRYSITFPTQGATYELDSSINSFVDLLQPGDTRTRFPTAIENLHQEVDSARQELFHARLFQTYTNRNEFWDNFFGAERRTQASEQVTEAVTVFNAAREAVEYNNNLRQAARARRAAAAGQVSQTTNDSNGNRRNGGGGNAPSSHPGSTSGRSRSR